jgi:hypothetical protein
MSLYDQQTPISGKGAAKCSIDRPRLGLALEQGRFPR